MPYALETFVDAPLPRAMPKDDLSTGRVPSTLQESIGGVFDTAGGNRRWPQKHEFSHKGLYEALAAGLDVRYTTNNDRRVTPTGDVRVVALNPILELREQTDRLKALIGARGPLYRRRFVDNALSWKTCRLLQVNHVEEVNHAGVISDVTSLYETLMVGWHEAAATLSNLAATPGPAASLVVNNSGLLPVYDGVVSIARTSGTITQITVIGGGVNFVWTGSLGAGQTLVIDAGAQTVTIGGADAYAGFALGPTANDWLPLEVGLNNLSVTVVGGNANLAMSHYNTWP